MSKTKKILLSLAFLLCLSFVAVSEGSPLVTEVQAATEGWKQSGKYWYYYVNGQKQTGFITVAGKTYYMDEKGRMCTGMQKLPQGRYYFDASGAMVKNAWVKVAYWYYCGTDGKIVTNTFLKQNGKTYCVNKNGAMYTGLCTVNGYKYYFDQDGAMQTGWVKIGKYWYYFVNDGRMRKGWLNLKDGTYFLHSNGRMAVGRVTNSKGDTYFFNNGRVKNNNSATGVLQKGWIQIGSNWYYSNETTGVLVKGVTTVGGKKYYLSPNSGVRLYGLRKINGKQYYFKPGSGEMAVDTKLTIGGVVYKFDEKGVGTVVQDYIVSGNVVKVLENGRWYTLQKEYIQHPGVADGSLSDDELLAALVYCESNDQGMVGMTAVALTILNRTISGDPYYPESLRYVIYQQSQYSPVFDGALARRLANPKGEMYTECMNAVKSAKSILNKYVKEGTKRKISGFNMGAKTDFDYLFFMTPGAFAQQGLDPEKCEMVQHKGHVFFTKWEK